MKDCLFCLIRKDWVVKTPEEEVRQALLHKMVEELQYPSSLIAVEKSLSHLEGKKRPQRRIDILCYAKAPDSSLFPLMLVECKKEVFSQKAFRQALGYNFYIGASFVALASDRFFQAVQ